jgi:hypothetical protein
MINSGLKQVTKPVNLHAAAGEQSGEILLNWNPVKTATTYCVFIKTKRVKKWKMIDIVDESFYHANKLTPNKEYKFRVSVIHNNGKQHNSNTVNIIVP